MHKLFVAIGFLNIADHVLCGTQMIPFFLFQGERQPWGRPPATGQGAASRLPITAPHGVPVFAAAFHRQFNTRCVSLFMYLQTNAIDGVRKRLPTFSSERGSVIASVKL